MNPVKERRSCLLVCGSWSPTKGGVPTFNRSLAIGLAEAGHRTGCLVEQATEAERDDAHSRGVTLLPAARTPAGPSLLLPTAIVREFGADTVIGHDRFTGEFAWAHARLYASARLVYIVHTAPPEIEPYKNSGRTADLIRQRERHTRALAAEADVVAAVGPRLERYAADLLADGLGPGRIVRLDPGMEVGAGTAVERRPPAKRHVLVLGRTDDIVLKGLDIAALAVAAVRATGHDAPGLLVRGAPENECDALHAQLVALSGLARERIEVRPYTVEPAELRRDLARSAVCVMPSRVEGFGLVALEAIAAGTPVLVSSKSGAAELLHRRLGRSAEPMIVEVADDLNADVKAWSAALGLVLSDLPSALGYAGEVRGRLAAQLRWRDTADSLVVAVPEPLSPEPIP
ncbi:glycosyltransferase family 4 protein [Streptomyces sp. NPDC006430]|uniref:glycosyltransferase family 4 protein n=1 Tax=Streptomyces sp. NPDC006430 TaxID=3154299 RepID=UPI0033A631B5